MKDTFLAELCPIRKHKDRSLYFIVKCLRSSPAAEKYERQKFSFFCLIQKQKKRAREEVANVECSLARGRCNGALRMEHFICSNLFA